MSTTRDDPYNDSYYGVFRGLQLEGLLVGERPSGGWPQWALRVRFGWGHVGRQDLPDGLSIHDWPLQDVSGLDELAKLNRSGPYYYIRNAADCQAALDFVQLGACEPVTAAVEITGEWVDPPKGIIPLSAGKSPAVGSHSFAIILATDEGFFGFLNSWGEEWGDGGCGYLPFQVFDERLITATTFLPPLETPPPSEVNIEDIELVTWVGHTHRGEAILVVLVYDRSCDDRLAWAFAIEREGRLECEELFVKPDVRRRGYGSRLVEALREQAFATGKELHFWVSFADSEPPKRPQLHRFFRRCRFGVAPSNVQWAPYVASKSISPKVIADVPFPEKPGRSLISLREWDSEPDWDAADLDPAVTEAAKRVFRRRRDLLRRLA